MENSCGEEGNKKKRKGGYNGVCLSKERDGRRKGNNKKQDLLRTPGCMGAPVMYARRAFSSIAATLQGG